MNEKKPKIIIVSVRNLLIRSIMAFSGLAIILIVNRTWIDYTRYVYHDMFPEIVRFLPLGPWAATVLWVVAAISASFASVRFFWNHKYFAGAIILAGYAFFGHVAMYLYPLHFIAAALSHTGLLRCNRFAVSIHEKDDLKKRESTHRHCDPRSDENEDDASR
ncbi:MAG: hypothetical protein K6A68_08655 [Clostridiales bacterium]|nr:hypothetical protein [Clostridiales bacterium]